MRVLVTGANGFVGSHLVDALLLKGYEVKCLIRKTSNLRWLIGKKVKFVFGDITQKESLSDAIRDVEYIYHTAGLVRAVNSRDYYWVNQQGTRNLIELCTQINSKLKKFVYLSSQAASGPGEEGRLLKEEDRPNPITDYGKSKLKGEEEILTFKGKLPFVILRPSAVYGPRDRDIYAYFKMVKKKVLPIFGKQEKYVNLCYVKDLVEGTILAAENEKSQGKIYFISDGKLYSWSEIGKIISEALRVKVRKLIIPEGLLSMVSFLNEIVSRITRKPALINKQKFLEMRQRYWSFDISRIKEDLGFLPKVPLEVGAKLTADWYYRNNWL